MPLTISHTTEITQKRKIGRNDPCHCGSGKKYKKCHLHRDEGYSTHERGGYISRIITWAMNQSWFTNELTKKLKSIYGENPRLEENQIAIVVEALIYEWKYKGMTPLQHFIEYNTLSSSDKQYYQSWVDKSVFSIFEIKEVKLGVSLLLIDLFHEQTYLAFETSGSYSLHEGMMITCRLVPFQDHWMMTGGNINVFPQELYYTFKREKNRGVIGHITELEYIDIFYKKKKQSSLDLIVPNQKHQNNKGEPGPKEQLLVRQMMNEAQVYIKNPAIKNANFLLQNFSEIWFNTPQVELKGRTPRDVIRDERAKLSNPHTELSYSVSMKQFSPSDDENYNNAIRLMQSEKDYLKALNLLSFYIPDALPEPFRWYNNVGICLIRLGEMKLAKKYFQRALELRPSYEMAQTNLANYKDTKIRNEMELWGRQELFLEMAREENTNFSKKILSLFDLIRTYSQQDQLKIYSVLFYTYEHGMADIPSSFGNNLVIFLTDQKIIRSRYIKYYSLTKYGNILVEELLDSMYEAIPKDIRKLP